MPDNRDRADEERLLAIVTGLARELHPEWRGTEAAGLDSALDRDLGLDSLARVELVMRLESAFGVGLSEQAMAEAETPRDLLRVVGSARPATKPRRRRAPAAAPREESHAVETPGEVRNMVEVLDWHVRAHPDRACVWLYEDAEEPLEITYARLHDGARQVAAGLQERDLEAGQPVALMLPTGRDYLYSFYGILMAGGLPVPIYPPTRPSQIEDHLHRQSGVMENARVPLLITVEEARRLAMLLRARVPTLREVVTREQLASVDATPMVPTLHGSDTAFLQYTSGSTGAPKGVVLSHDDLLSNIRIMGDAVSLQPEDRFVSWLPMYHDMGLIGAWLGTLYYGLPLVLMSPLAFLMRPGRWLWALHEHAGTMTAAPNFAYQLCLDKLKDEDLEGLDLSRLRIAFNGAEPISPDTLRQFCDRFEQYGFRRHAMKPVYGLAEAAVGLAFPPLEREPVIDRVQREVFTCEGRAEPAREENDTALEFVASGQPLSGYEIRVVDRAGRELPERHEGRIEFTGPSATSGYYRNPDATRELFRDGWLDTGDMGYIAGGDIHVTTRVKDLIIRAGRNIHPYEVEEAVGEVEGVRKGCVAVFGSPDDSGTERVVVVAETRERDPGAREKLHEAVRSAATGPLGMAPDDVVLAPPRTVLKTSSGKIRRGAVRVQYERGRLAKGSRAVWWQVARVALSALAPRWRALYGQVAALAWATRARVVFWLIAPFLWLGAALLPWARARWALIRGGARVVFRLCGVPLHVAGREHFPDHGPCVIVANHASYLDGSVLVAALPDSWRFVAKAELGRQFIAGTFLRRIGAQFVERFDKQKSIEDAKNAVRGLRGGDRLLSFPEGTLIRAPGLLPFHMGPFLAAAEAGVPVVPVVIRGTRSILRSGSWFPRRGAASVRVLEPIEPEGDDWDAALRLRDAAREAMLGQVGEPDLAGDREVETVLRRGGE